MLSLSKLSLIKLGEVILAHIVYFVSLMMIVLGPFAYCIINQIRSITHVTYYSYNFLNWSNFRTILFINCLNILIIMVQWVDSTITIETIFGNLNICYGLEKQFFDTDNIV